MTPITAGRMDRRIVIETATVTQDTDGAELLIWPPVGGTSRTCWAEWVPGSTSETFQNQQWLKASIDGVYRVYGPPVPPPEASRILGHDGRIYDLKPATEIGRGNGWEIPVTAHGETQ